MKKMMIACTIATLLSTSSFAQAKDNEKTQTHKETVIGMSTGAIFGGIIGGPIGVFVGAFAGGLIGEQDVAQDKLEEQKRALIVMQEKTDDYHHVLAHNEKLTEQLGILEQHNERLTRSQMKNLMAMTVQFKTGSSEIAPHFAKQLDQLVNLLKGQPTLLLDLNGFADQRGDKQANLQLSKKRVSAVQSYLIKHGVSHTRLTANAFGEQHTLANSDTYEENVFDRRVTLTTRPRNVSQTASND